MPRFLNYELAPPPTLLATYTLYSILAKPETQREERLRWDCERDKLVLVLMF